MTHLYLVPKDYPERIRFVANEDRPSEWQEYLARVDADERDPAGDLWFPAAIFGLVTLIGGVAFWIGAAL